jgi:hypothetical protein
MRLKRLIQKEIFYAVKEIAAHWSLSTDKVQELFLTAYYNGEKGIIALVGPSGRWKTVRHTLRISEGAKSRMYERLQTAA